MNKREGMNNTHLTPPYYSKSRAPMTVRVNSGDGGRNSGEVPLFRRLLSCGFDSMPVQICVSLSRAFFVRRPGVMDRTRWWIPATLISSIARLKQPHHSVSPSRSRRSVSPSRRRRHHGARWQRWSLVTGGGRGGARVVIAQDGGRFLLLGLGLADAWRRRKTKAGFTLSRRFHPRYTHMSFCN